MSRGTRFDHEHTIGDRVYLLTGKVTPATWDTLEIQGDPAEVNITSVTRDGVDACDEFDALVDEAALEAIEAEIIAEDEERYRSGMEGD